MKRLEKRRKREDDKQTVRLRSCDRSKGALVVLRYRPLCLDQKNGGKGCVRVCVCVCVRVCECECERETKRITLCSAFSFFFSLSLPPSLSLSSLLPTFASLLSPSLPSARASLPSALSTLPSFPFFFQSIS